MKKYIVKRAGNKGKGLFATKNIKENEIILKNNIQKLKKLTLKDISKLPEKVQEHADYAGKDRYVIDFSPSSYINHSCNPNSAWKSKFIGKTTLYAQRNIKKGEEITVDYALNAVDQFGDNSFWKMKCQCKSKNCRKIITGDFFKLPKKIQVKYWKNLPISIRIKYKDKMK